MLAMGATAKSIGSASSPDSNYAGQEFQIECFRCGECCTRYKVRLSLIEARRVADGLGLSLDAFLEKYVDQRWLGLGSFLLRLKDGACVFLERKAVDRERLCLIHHLKPDACRDWTPSLYRKECKEGLAKHWNLTVNETGQFEGSTEDIKRFQGFVESPRREAKIHRYGLPNVISC